MKIRLTIAAFAALVIGGVAAACADLGPFDVTLCNPIDSVIFSPNGDTLRVYQTARCN